MSYLGSPGVELSRPWRAELRFKGQRIYLGHYETKTKAHIAEVKEHIRYLQEELEELKILDDSA